ncbi:glycosyltransferase [Rickettsiales bacterium]|nr:glycosyltransferase [Rickettsiales bacterium]
MTKEYPRITVITAVYNGAKHIERMMQSLIDQKYPNLEHIIMDAGSKDGTVELLQKYKEHITHLHSGPDRGHSDATNKALEFATGEIICLLNADDTYEDGALMKVAKAWIDNPGVDMVSFGATIKKVNEDGTEKIIAVYDNPKHYQMTLHNLLYCPLLTASRFWRRDVFERFGKILWESYDGKYLVASDREFLLRLCLNKVKNVSFPGSVYNFYSHDDSLTFGKGNVLRCFKEHIFITQNILDNKKISDEEMKQLKGWQVDQSVKLFVFSCLQMNFKEAFLALKEGVSKWHIFWIMRCLLYPFEVIGRRIYRMF